MARIGVGEEDGGDLGLFRQLRHVDVVLETVLGAGVVARSRPLARALMIPSTRGLEEVQMDLFPRRRQGTHRVSDGVGEIVSVR